MYGGAPGEGRLPYIFFGLIADHRNAVDALQGRLLGNLLHRQLTVNRLATCHGNGIVEQQFIGDVNAGTDRRAYRQRTGVKIGTVPEVLENMRGFHEGLLTNPGSAFSTHLTERIGLPVHPGNHVVAANTALPPAPLRKLGGAVMGAA